MKKKYSVEEINLIVKMKQSGATYAQIAEKTGRSVGAITQYFASLRKIGTAATPCSAPAPAPAPARKPTLDDFTPREIIKHLYDLGYRIEGDSLYLIQKTRVKLGEICS